LIEYRSGLFIKGCVSWNVGDDSHACIVLSILDDFKIKEIENFSDMIDDKGFISKNLFHFIYFFNQAINERAAENI